MLDAFGKPVHSARQLFADVFQYVHTLENINRTSLKYLRSLAPAENAVDKSVNICRGGYLIFYVNGLRALN